MSSPRSLSLGSGALVSMSDAGLWTRANAEAM